MEAKEVLEVEMIFDQLQGLGKIQLTLYKFSPL